LEFSIHFADNYSTETLSHRRVPFLLIEDALDGLTIEESLSIWGMVESLADVIIKPDFFAKGLYIVFLLVS